MCWQVRALGLPFLLYVLITSCKCLVYYWLSNQWMRTKTNQVSHPGIIQDVIIHPREDCINDWCIVDLFFPKVIFLLILLEFCLLHPNHTYLPILPCQYVTPCHYVIPSPKTTDTKPKSKSSLCCPHTHWGMVKVPGTCTLRKLTSPPVPLPEAISYEELHLSIPIMILF